MSKKTRKPANQVLLDFLKENKISFYVRRQEVRYLDDNGMMVEPPKLQVYYEDEIPQKGSAPAVKK